MNIMRGGMVWRMRLRCRNRRAGRIDCLYGINAKGMMIVRDLQNQEFVEGISFALGQF